MTEAELARWKETSDMFCNMDAHGRRAYGTFIEKDYNTTIKHLLAAECAAMMLSNRIAEELGQ